MNNYFTTKYKKILCEINMILFELSKTFYNDDILLKKLRNSTNRAIINLVY